jgi:predicted DNA-binding transcriptional regulator AlpA
MEHSAIGDSQLLYTRADLKRLGITVSNSSLLRWEANARFPRRIRMAGTSVAWIAAEVTAWLAARAEERSRTHYADPL